MGTVEHRNIYPDDSDGRIHRLANGWVWISTSAERGPSGKANVGGVGALISNTFFAAYLYHKSISARILAFVFQRQQTNCNTKNQIHILVVYSPTATTGNEAASQTHYELLTGYIGGIPLGDIVILVGDFNATLSTDSPLPTSQKAHGMRRRILYSPKVEKQNGNATRFREFLEENDLYPLNARLRQPHSGNYYTFSGPNGRQARLDYILVRGKWSSGFRSITVRPPRNIGSDHKMVIARGKWRLSRQVQRQVQKRRDFSVLKDERVGSAFLQSINQRFTFHPEDSLDDIFSSFVAAYEGACAEVNIPCMTRRQRRMPWEDHEVVRLRAERKLAKQHYRCNRTATARKALSEISIKLKAKYQERYEAYILAMCERIGENLAANRVDIAHQLLNEVCGGKKSRTSARIKGDSAEERLRAWYEHFSNEVFSATGASDDSDPVHLELTPVLPEEVGGLFNTGVVTVGELEFVVETMSRGKAAGVDNIPAEVFKIPGFMRVAVGIINAAFSRTDVPQAWRTLIVVPVPKKGDLSLPANYRGISLMCIISKIYNKTLLLRIRSVLDQRLLNMQNGFRPKRSTLPHIISLRELLRYCRSVDGKDLSLLLLFIDYTKAFDSVNWAYLRAILIAYRIPVRLVNAIMSLYRGATARVRTSDGLTDEIKLSRGVLQGDTLAPYLFVLVIDYVMRKATEEEGNSFLLPPLSNPANSTVGAARSTRAARLREQANTEAAHGLRIPGTLFADDMALVVGGALALAVTAVVAQRFLQHVESAGLPAGLTVNAKKTEYMVVTKSKLVTKGVTVQLNNGAKLNQVRDYKFLGSFLASERADIARRLFSGWVPVRRLAKFWKSGVSERTAMAMFTAICQTVFLYPSPSWVLDPKLEATLNGCYTRMLRFAKGLSYSGHPTISTIYGEMPTVIEVIARRRLVLVGSVFQEEHTVPQLMPAVLRELAARRITRKTWSRRPERSFIDQLFEDLARIGLESLSFDAATVRMKNIRQWAADVKAICATYSRPAPLDRPLRSSRGDREGESVTSGPTRKSSVASGASGLATPLSRRPSPNRSNRLLQKAARALSRRNVGLPSAGGSEYEGVDSLFREVQSMRLTYPVGTIPYFPSLDDL